MGTPKEPSPDALFQEAWSASAGHLRLAERLAAPLAERLREIERSGRALGRAEATLAAGLAKELVESQDRLQRLKLYRRR
jgi:hypothetical protein